LGLSNNLSSSEDESCPIDSHDEGDAETKNDLSLESLMKERLFVSLSREILKMNSSNSIDKAIVKDYVKIFPSLMNDNWITSENVINILCCEQNF
jgi:hypothetical protein